MVNLTDELTPIRATVIRLLAECKGRFLIWPYGALGAEILREMVNEGWIERRQVMIAGLRIEEYRLTPKGRKAIR